jgi:hypothetical protein
LDVILKSHPEIITAVASAAIIIVLRLLLLIEEAKTLEIEKKTLDFEKESKEQENLYFTLFSKIILAYEKGQDEEQLLTELCFLYKKNQKCLQHFFLQCNIKSQTLLFCAFCSTPLNTTDYNLFLCDVFSIVLTTNFDDFLKIRETIFMIHEVLGLYTKTNEFDEQILLLMKKTKKTDPALLKTAFKTFFDDKDPQNKIQSLKASLFPKKQTTFNTVLFCFFVAFVSWPITAEAATSNSTNIPVELIEGFLPLSTSLLVPGINKYRSLLPWINYNQRKYYGNFYNVMDPVTKKTTVKKQYDVYGLDPSEGMSRLIVQYDDSQISDAVLTAIIRREILIKELLKPQSALWDVLKVPLLPPKRKGVKNVWPNEEAARKFAIAFLLGAMPQSTKNKLTFVGMAVSYDLTDVLKENIQLFNKIFNTNTKLLNKIPNFPPLNENEKETLFEEFASKTVQWSHLQTKAIWHVLGPDDLGLDAAHNQAPTLLLYTRWNGALDRPMFNALRFWFSKDQFLRDANVALPVLRTTDLTGFASKHEERLNFVKGTFFNETDFFEKYIVALLKLSFQDSTNYSQAVHLVEQLDDSTDFETLVRKKAYPLPFSVKTQNLYLTLLEGQKNRGFISEKITLEQRFLSVNLMKNSYQWLVNNITNYWTEKVANIISEDDYLLFLEFLNSKKSISFDQEKNFVNTKAAFFKLIQREIRGIIVQRLIDLENVVILIVCDYIYKQIPESTRKKLESNSTQRAQFVTEMQTTLLNTNGSYIYLNNKYTIPTPFFLEELLKYGQSFDSFCDYIKTTQLFKEKDLLDLCNKSIFYNNLKRKEEKNTYQKLISAAGSIFCEVLIEKLNEIKEARRENIAKAFNACIQIQNGSVTIKNITNNKTLTLNHFRLFLSNTFDLEISKNYLFKTGRIELASVEKNKTDSFASLDEQERMFINLTGSVTQGKVDDIVLTSLDFHSLLFYFVGLISLWTKKESDFSLFEDINSDMLFLKDPGLNTEENTRTYKYTTLQNNSNWDTDEGEAFEGEADEGEADEG